MPHIGNLEVERESLVVLYDPDTGDIFHMHYVETMKGGKHPDLATLEKDAHDQLKQMQPGLTKKVAVLHADPHSTKSGSVYKVDTAKGGLMETRASKS